MLHVSELAFSDVISDEKIREHEIPKKYEDAWNRFMESRQKDKFMRSKISTHGGRNVDITRKTPMDF